MAVVHVIYLITRRGVWRRENEQFEMLGLVSCPLVPHLRPRRSPDGEHFETEPRKLSNGFVFDLIAEASREVISRTPPRRKVELRDLSGNSFEG